MMGKIVVIGSVTGAPSDARMLYDTLVAACQPYTATINSPLDTMEFRGSESERYRRAMNLIGEADIIVAEVSTPSTGQGMEIQEAARQKKLLVAVASKGARVSPLVLGCPGVRGIAYYDNLSHLSKVIDMLLRNVIDQKGHSS